MLRGIIMRTLALSIFALAFGIQFGRAEAIWSSYVKTNRYDFTVTDAEMAKTPVWREQDDDPPLAARKALRLARTRLAELVTDSKDWTLDALSLCEWHDGRHWYYLARFQAPLPAGGLNGMPVSMRIPVLMSGEVVKPQVSRWPK